MTISISDAIIQLGGSYSDFIRIVGNTYEGIEWVDEAKFTKEEVETEYATLLDAASVQQVKDNRLNAYKKESDPLFFKAQRGEITLAVWEEKVQEIRDRFPYPEP